MTIRRRGRGRARLYTLLGAGLVAAFGAGIWAGHFRTFPVPQLIELKRDAERRLQGGDAIFVNDEAVAMARSDGWLDGPADVVMVGDSITQGGKWGEFYPGLVIHNRGISGDTVTGVLGRTEAILAKRPQRVFLMIGIVDVLSGNTNSRIVAVYRRILERLEGETDVHVQSVLQCTGSQCDEETRERISALNRDLQTIAERSGATFIDLNPVFAPDGYLRADLTEDGIHLNAAGYRLWRSTIADEVQGSSATREDAERGLQRPAG